METIYILMDPRDGSIRYVGRSGIKLQHRLCVHKYKARNNIRPKSKLYRWMNDVLSAGLEPLIIPIAQASAGLEASILEQFYIRSCNAARQPILNSHYNRAINRRI